MSTVPDITLSGSAAGGCSTTGQHAGGRSGGKRPCGSQGGYQRNNTTSGLQAATMRNRTLFRVNTKAMGGNVFACHEEQDDRRQYTKTIEVLDAYAKKTLPYADNMAPLFCTRITTPSIYRPSPFKEGANKKFEEMIYADKVKEYMTRARTLTSNLAMIFAVGWGQCSEDMKVQVKTHEGFNDKSIAKDCVWLIQQIKSVTLQFNDSKDVSFSSGCSIQLSFLQTISRTIRQRVCRESDWVGGHHQNSRQDSDHQP